METRVQVTLRGVRDKVQPTELQSTLHPATTQGHLVPPALDPGEYSENREDPMRKPVDTARLQEQVVAAYLAGEKITDIEERFGIGRSSLYWFLRKAGVPSRSTQRHQNDSTVDMIIAGQRELISLLERRIKELEADLEAFKRARAVAAKADGHGATPSASRVRKLG
jgi:hypothetical protein